MRSVVVLLQDSLRLYRTHAALFAGYAAWLLLPYAGLILLDLLPAHGFVDLLKLLLLLAEMLLWGWVWIILIHAVHRLSEGKPFDGIAAQLKTRETFPFVLVAFILQTAVVTGGLILLLVPGIIFGVWFLFSPFAAALEGKRGVSALSSSKTLVSGRFWAVAWRAFAGPFLIALVYYPILSLIIGLIGAFTSTPPEAFLQTDGGPPVWSEVIASVADVFLLPLSISYFTQLYLDLKKTAQAARVEPLYDTRTDHRTGNPRPTEDRN